MLKMRRFLISIALAFFAVCGNPRLAYAQTGAVLGIHILNPSEAQVASELLKVNESEQWHYVTIPLTVNDLNKQVEWQAFMNYAKSARLIPIVRLGTTYQNNAWVVPTKKNITDLVGFLSALEWPTEERYIIVFNEVNHAKEWGGRVDPVEYADTLRFTSNWARSEGKNYQILPAAMDLAAPNGSVTREAFAYLDQMRQEDPEIWGAIDVWNSHSYPNPGFTGSAWDSGKMSIKGYQLELAYIKEMTGRDLKTFITETGWLETGRTRGRLVDYYTFAAEHVWGADDRVVAVTPFVLAGAPGPFGQFSFLDQARRPTQQYFAYQVALKKLGGR